MKSAIALKALIVLTSHAQLGNTGKPTGWYLPEAAHPYYALKDAGIEVDFASPKGGAAPMDERSRDLTDAENARFLKDSDALKKSQHTISAADIKLENYGAIIFAGGHGTMWDFADDKSLAKAASGIYEKGGIVAAVCHGPAALVNVKLTNGEYLVNGKKIATFTDSEERAAGLDKVVPFMLETRLKERGAKVREAADWSENVVVDGRLVTGQNPASAKKLGKEVARLLKSK